MAFDDYELSDTLSTPVELYTFVTPATTYRLTSWHRDVVFGGATFTACPASRSSIQVVDMHTDQYDVTVEVPAAHALAQYYANGVAPQEVSCLIQRYQPSSGIAIQMHFGYVDGLSFKDRMASMRVPANTADALQTECPSVVGSKLCNHVLYDSRCQQVEATFKVTTTISAISADGRTITTVGAVPGPVDGGPVVVNGVHYSFSFVQWSAHGRMKHVLTGQSRTIIAEDLTHKVFTIQIEFGGGVGGINVGDTVEITAGCDRSRGQCKAKFANVINFGGHPDMSRSNPWYVSLLSTTGQDV